ncbi:hypothetical protein MKZ38_003834 [Zalerion maritima]|uniref:U3 small nucleolar RNA-associated protein 15 C-terminal domain-containing protein n=1 Tax=Zalerion maritima TaxID=339359 RepID=A0AAD5WQD3_9PEZI|nr:hypothetical protein MKZ38_003834 [Zalerion maritima]
MAAQVQPLQQVRLPAAPTPTTAEQRYWKTFKSQLILPSPTTITHIFSPNTPQTCDHFAVTSGNRVQLYSTRTRKPVKTITRFSTTARSGEIRRDGRIVVAGDDNGLIQVFDASSRAILKTWEKEHKPLPVWTTKFGNGDLTTLMSCGDDKTVRLWDLPGNSSTRAFLGHKDYVRTGSFMPDSSTMLASGSYDSTVRIWDSRSPGRAVLTFKHAHPVECVLPMPSGTVVLAASGSQISVLDLVAAKPQHLIQNHQKTVMDLSLASSGQRLVSGGLDGHVKIFETAAWNVVAGLKYSAPVHAVSVITSGQDKHDRHLCVATAARESAFLSIRTRLAGRDAAREKERRKEMSALLSGSIASYDSARGKRKRTAERNREMDALASEADAVIGEPGTLPGQAQSRSKRRKEARWHKQLRQGRFPPALDHVLDKSQKDYSPLNVLTLLTALRHRSALRESLEGRDEEGVMPILKWACGHVSDPRYLGVCVDVALELIDLYAEHCPGSQELEEAFRTLCRRVKMEVERAQVAVQTGGMVETLVLGGAA